MAMWMRRASTRLRRKGKTEALHAAVAAAILSFLCILAGLRGHYLIGGALVAANASLIAVSLRRETKITNVLSRLLDVIAKSGLGRFDSQVLTSIQPHELDARLSSIAEELRGKVDHFREAALRDGLTGLSNRAHFQQTAQRLLSRDSSGTGGALVFIDLDGFKSINDALGHNVGDRLLQIAADRMRIVAKLNDPAASEAGSLGREALIARLGGDEFVAYLDRPKNRLACTRFATRLLRVLSEPFEIEAHTVSAGASIGVAVAPQDASNLEGLIRAADTAMYHAKRAGRGRVEFYDPAMEDEARERAEEEQELRDALMRGGMELHFQPLFNLLSMRIVGAEALIRWRHPRRGLLLPRHFLHVVDRADLVSQLGEWVVNEGVRRIAEFERAGNPVGISVNVSPRQLEQTDFVSIIRTALSKWGATPSLLQIEITEDAALRDPEIAAQHLHEIARLGVSVAIDDFGTGYSNLASLITLPISRLKIDKSLMDDLAVRPEARLLVQTIITMANGLGLHTIAEGVETEVQRELLADMGCDIGQGFLMSRAVEADELRRQLVGESPQSGWSKSLSSAA